jgi:hypothetical protein
MGLFSGFNPLDSLMGGGGGGGSSSFESGGIGNSKSANESTTYSPNVGAGDDSTVNAYTNIVSGSGNTLTDNGAVSQAIKLALAGVEGANANAQQATAAQGGLLTGALKLAGEQQQAAMDTLSNIKTSDIRVLILAGLAVVAVVAVMAFKGKKA